MACQFCTMPGGKHDDGCPYDQASRKPETITLSPKVYDAFARALDDPQKPNEALRELLCRKRVWTR